MHESPWHLISWNVGSLYETAGTIGNETDAARVEFGAANLMENTIEIETGAAKVVSEVAHLMQDIKATADILEDDFDAAKNKIEVAYLGKYN